MFKFPTCLALVQDHTAGLFCFNYKITGIRINYSLSYGVGIWTVAKNATIGFMNTDLVVYFSAVLGDDLRLFAAGISVYMS